jgi:hypothetical protein
MLKFGHRKIAVVPLLGILCLSGALLAATAAIGGVRINTSYSLPMGIYVRTHDHDARLIEFCPAEPVRLGIQRARIPDSWHGMRRRCRTAVEAHRCRGWGSGCSLG